MNVAAHTAITFGTNPTALGDYPLFGGDISGFNAANFILPAAPANETYSLQVVSGGVDLVVAAVPEPGTLALLGHGLLSLLACRAAAESGLRTGGMIPVESSLRS